MSKDSGSFLRKVVRFVANPTTDWSELDAPPSDPAESDYAKTEIKAMIERKRRNDFVRKRELDMLRKIRREGLNPDAALAMGSISNLDPESRLVALRKWLLAMPGQKVLAEAGYMPTITEAWTSERLANPTN